MAIARDSSQTNKNGGSTETPAGDDDTLRPLLARLRPGKTPNWSLRNRIGVALAKQLEPVCTLEEIAEHFGTTKQRMYHEVASALGTLACRLYQHSHRHEP